MGGLVAQPASERRQERVNPGEIVLQFTANEKALSEAFRQYTYTQEARFQILRRDGTAYQERHIVAEVGFNEEGQRELKTISDKGGLTFLQLTQRDLDYVLDLDPFELTSDKLDYYRVAYKGQEQVDELDTYVFEVRPRRMDAGQRYFEGRIWVDQESLYVVKTKGKPVFPEAGDEKFPEYETLRQQIDGHWFPVWSRANQILFFTANSVHLNVLTTREDFQKHEPEAPSGEDETKRTAPQPNQEPPPNRR
ncbi:MAG TPA: hypothetical protein VLV83_23365 [Acidobacteriota bacterium]|nr:hypothetical protein [Acidobacteriota bacterium]